MSVCDAPDLFLFNVRAAPYSFLILWVFYAVLASARRLISLETGLILWDIRACVVFTLFYTVCGTV